MSRLRSIAMALFPAVFLALVVGAVFAVAFGFSHRTFYLFPDNIDQFYAWYQKLAYHLHAGSLPLWDANVSAGHSFTGELQQGVFYPINLLWVWLFGSASGIGIVALEAIVVFHFWLAALGMFYALRSLGMRTYSSLAGGLIFAFGGTVAVRSVSQTAIFFGLCLIPWAFYAFNTWMIKKNKLYLLLTGFWLGMIILSGHIQPWYHALFIITLFILLRNPSPTFEKYFKTLLRNLLGLVAAIALSAIVALPQIITSAQYLPQSYRFVGDSQPIGPGDKVSIKTFINGFSFKPHDTLSLVDPVKYPVVDGNEIYIGLVGLAAIAAVFILMRPQLRQHTAWRKYKIFLIGSMTITGIIMLGYWTFVPAVMRLLPLVSQIRQLARYSIVIHFCLVVLATIAVEVIVRFVTDNQEQSRKRRMAYAGAGILAAGLLAVNALYLFLLSRHGGIDKHFVYQNIVLVLALVGVLVIRRRAAYVLVGAMVLFATFQPVWFMPKKAYSESTYPSEYYKRTAVIDYLEKEYGRSRVMILENALPVNIGNVYDIQTTNGYGATLHSNFFDFLNEPETEETKGIHMDLLNVRYVVSKTPQKDLQQVLYDDDRQVYVYERPNFVPRVYYADQAEVCIKRQPECTEPKVGSYNDSYIKVMTESDTAETLVFSEVYYKGWQAYVDGQEVPITPYGITNIKLFRSVEVPAGKHTVELRYKPFGF